MASNEQPVKYSGNQAPTAGMREDVDGFIERVVELFDESATLRFDHFRVVWKSTKFGLIFHGRPVFRELVEFTEDLFEMVKRLIMPPEKLGVRAAALYLLYALYFKQPTRPVIRIPVTLDEMKALMVFVDECRSGHHWELAYIWAKLLLDKSFTFVATTKPVGMENAGNANASKLISHNRLDAGDDSFAKSELFRDMVEKIGKVDRRYCNMKAALTGGSGTNSDLGLALVPENFSDRLASEVDRSLSESTSKANSKFKKSNASATKSDSGIGQRRKQLRQQAFAKGKNVESEAPAEKAKKAKKSGEKKAPVCDGDFQSLALSSAVIKTDESLLSLLRDS